MRSRSAMQIAAHIVGERAGQRRCTLPSPAHRGLGRELTYIVTRHEWNRDGRRARFHY